MKNRLFSLALAGVLSLSLVLPVGAAGVMSIGSYKKKAAQILYYLLPY